MAEWRRRKAEDSKFEWKMPLNFYGKVIDEAGNPVVGALVDFTWTNLSVEGTAKVQAHSDAHGRFELTNQRGKRLEVRISKEGYDNAHRQSFGSFEYAAFFEPNFHEPDLKAPVIFRLRKKGIPEALIERQTLYGFRIDGTPHHIDLETGKKTVGGTPVGDITVRCTRPLNAGRRFDWSLVLEGVGDAGLFESNDELVFAAPAEGYQPKIEYSFKTDDPTWRGELQKRLFVRSRSGQVYALLQADIRPVYNQEAAINLRVYVNPRGSRNLEPRTPR